MNNLPVAKKSLGQHWLKDEPTLKYISELGNIGPGDTILEIGPGQGALTKHLLQKAKKVVAVELDPYLAANLKKNISRHISSLSEDRPWNGELEVVQGDILKFDLTKLPRNYKVVANIPYYLTSNLLRVLAESTNPPSLMVLLVQKEVAQRIAANPGQMSLLSVSVQLYYKPGLGDVVPAQLFTPKPKVDSQIVILQRRPKPLFPRTVLGNRGFFRIVKAGFSGRRKKLRSSLSAGLNIDKLVAEKLLSDAGIDANLRAQSLSLEDWYRLYQQAKQREVFKE